MVTFMPEQTFNRMARLTSRHGGKTSHSALQQEYLLQRSIRMLGSHGAAQQPTLSKCFTVPLFDSFRSFSDCWIHFRAGFETCLHHRLPMVLWRRIQRNDQFASLI